MKWPAGPIFRQVACTCLCWGTNPEKPHEAGTSTAAFCWVYQRPGPPRFRPSSTSVDQLVMTMEAVRGWNQPRQLLLAPAAQQQLQLQLLDTHVGRACAGRTYTHTSSGCHRRPVCSVRLQHPPLWSQCLGQVGQPALSAVTAPGLALPRQRKLAPKSIPTPHSIYLLFP